VAKTAAIATLNQRDISWAIPYSSSFNLIGDLQSVMTRSLRRGIERRARYRRFIQTRQTMQTDAAYFLSDRSQFVQDEGDERMTASRVGRRSTEGRHDKQWQCSDYSSIERVPVFILRWSF
jgi:hypothetical protein